MPNPQLCLLLALFVLPGCFNAGLQPRAGRVLDPGQWSTGVTVDLLGIAGALAIQKDQGYPISTPQQHGTLAVLNTAVSHPFMLALLNTELIANLGVSSGLEVGVTLGLHEISTGFRVRVLDERRGQPVSLAAGAAAAWRPYTGGPWFRLGLDAGWHREPGFASAAIYLSRGPEAYIAPFQEDSMQEIRLIQTELRVHGALGGGVRRRDSNSGEETFLVLVQASGYRVLVAPKVTDSMTCEVCKPRPSKEGWRVPPSWGGHLSTTLMWRGWFL